MSNPVILKQTFLTFIIEQWILLTSLQTTYVQTHSQPLVSYHSSSLWKLACKYEQLIGEEKKPHSNWFVFNVLSLHGDAAANTDSSKHSNSGVVIPDSSEPANIKLFIQEKTNKKNHPHSLSFICYASVSDITAHECSFFGSQMLVCPQMHHQEHLSECSLVTNCFTMQQ